MPEIPDLTRLRMILMLRRQLYWWKCEYHRAAQLHTDVLAASSPDANARGYWLHVSMIAARTAEVLADREHVFRQGVSLAEHNKLEVIERATPWADLNSYDLATSMSILEAFDEEMLTRG